MKTFLTLEITEKNMKRRSLIVNKKRSSVFVFVELANFFNNNFFSGDNPIKRIGSERTWLVTNWCIISILVIHYCYQCLSTLKVRRHQKLVITNWRPTKQTLYFFTTKKNSLAHRGAPVGKHCSKPVFHNRRVVGILFWVTKTCFVVIF